LIEVLVAMTILAVGILGVMGAFSVCTQAAARGFRLDEAAGIAEKELNLAMISPPSNLEPQSGAVDQFTWKLTFAEKPYGLVLASIQVDWTEKGEPRAYPLAQLFEPRQ
jgi:hypothetical protein